MENKEQQLGGKLSINGKVYGIYGGVNTIGRNKDAVVDIKNLGISQHHAILILADDDLHFISDLKSSNGTFLNGTKLVPLQLYQIENNATVKFGNIEGTYNKLSSASKDQIPENAERSQFYTQGFYGSSTQEIDDNSPETNKTKLTPTQNSNYISTLSLVNAVNEIEKLHEQCTLIAPQNQNQTSIGNEEPTQLIDSQVIREMSHDMAINDTLNHLPDDEFNLLTVGYNHVPLINDHSIIDSHEAETQIFPLDSHEAETQIIPINIDDSGNSLQVDIHEVETQKIILNSEKQVSTDNEIGAPIIETTENKDSSENCSSPTQSVQTENEKAGLAEKPLQTQNSISESSQNSSVIAPLGRCRNIIYDSSDDDDNESDIRPGGICKNNAFGPTQESVHNEADIDEADCSSNDSVEFMTMQKVNSLEKKSPEVKNVETVSTTECSNDKDKKNDETVDDSETDIEDQDGDRLTIGRNEIKEDSTKKNSQNKNQNESDSETDIDENYSNPKINAMNKEPKQISSDSDTEIEDNLDEIEKKISAKNVSISEEQETSFKTNSDKMSTSYDEPDSGDENLMIDETRYDDSLQDIRLSIPPQFHVQNKNESLNESDLIPNTQEECRSVKSTSQSSKLESEESFKLGLTQMMEDETTSQKSKNSQSNLLENEVEIHEISTQESRNDDHSIKEPSPKSPLKKVTENKYQVDDELYISSTQRLVECSEKDRSIEDIYVEATQKLDSRTSEEKESNEDIFIEPTQTLGSSSKTIEEVYIKPTQKLVTVEKNKTVEPDFEDDDDMFATQPMSPPKSPGKAVESELECMFASQRPAQTELDNIQNVVFQKSIVDTKLPEKDSDLEAILLTQSMTESPSRKRTRAQKEAALGRSIESQLEVLFASQQSNLSTDKFLRPKNPLVDVLKDDSQEQIASKDEEERSNRNGLEQSFALLESKSTKIKRSTRNTSSEEITVYSRARRSNTIIPKEELEKIQEKSILKSRKRELSSTSSVETGRKNLKSEQSTSTRSANKAEKSGKIQKVDGNSENKTATTRKTKRIQAQNDSKDERSKIENSDDSSQEIVENAKNNGRKRGKSAVKSPVIEKKIAPSRKISTRTTKAAPEDIQSTDDDDFEDSSISTRKSNRKNTMKKSENSTVDRKDVKNKKDLTIPSKNTRQKLSVESDDLSENDVQTVTRTGRSKRNEAKKANVRDSLSETSTISSRSARKLPSIDPNTPLKRRKIDEIASTSTDSIDTPTRNKRKLKPKVAFTMMEDPSAESAIRRLGGSIVDSIQSCTVLITKSVKRSEKLLAAVGLGKPICSTNWVDACKIYNQFLDPWDFVMEDAIAEKKWDFSLKTSLERSRQSKLFKGYTFQLQVTTALDVLKSAIECCGGKVVTKIPKGTNNMIIVAPPDNKGKISRLSKQHPNVEIIDPEAIFDGVLRQELRFERHKLY